MCRASCVSSCLLVAVLLLLPAPAAAGWDRWDCAIDLHQGDTGTLTISRTGTSLVGRIIVSRNGVPSEHAIDGEWSDDRITFIRHLSATGRDIQAFTGVALAGDDGRARMAGRFARSFEGVWSADCKAGPTDLPDPPSRDAIDPKPPLGGKPDPNPAKGTCTISGTATGPRADVSTIFSAILYGPNTLTRHRATARFTGGRFQFTDLPDGQYRLVIDTRADTPVRVTPNPQTVTCAGGAVPDLRIEFR